MNSRILFVDDEPNVLSAIRRALRGKVELTTVDDPLAALDTIRSSEPFAVIVSDMRMPGMDGVEFLQNARKISPDSVRLMLTGNADQKTAVDAVNDGEVFRFLTKPCDPEFLHKTLQSAIRQYALITAEKELLEKTLKGSIKVLSEVLSITNPEAFGRTNRIRTKSVEIGKLLDDVCEWELDTAASLCLLGCTGLRAELLAKVQAGEELGKSEREEYIAHPLLSAELISQIPRMQGVANAILYQHKNFDGSGFPRDELKGADLPVNARILRVVLDYDQLKSQGWSDSAIFESMNEDATRYDPGVLAALHQCLDDSSMVNTARVGIRELQNGMVVREDINTTDGVLLICSGQEVTATLRNHLDKFVNAGVLNTKVLVTIPDLAAQSSAA